MVHGDTWIPRLTAVTSALAVRLALGISCWSATMAGKLVLLSLVLFARLSVCSLGSSSEEAVSVGGTVVSKYSAVIAAFSAAKETGSCTDGILVEVPNKHQWVALPQTPNHLLQVMHQEGYSDGDLQQVSKCLTRNMQWFGDARRRSSRTYAAHCIGTAGAMALAHKSAVEVCAAALHSIYAFGEPTIFTRCKLDRSSRVEGDCSNVELFKRERAAVAQDPWVGTEVERLVTFYQLFPTCAMDSSDIFFTHRALQQRGMEFFSGLSPWGIAMHVANELDEYVNWDAVVGPNRRRPYDVMVQFLELAEAFGEHKLAEGLYYSYSQFLKDEHLASIFKIRHGQRASVKSFPSIGMFEALTAVDGRLAPN